MTERDITSTRSTLEYLRQSGQLLVIKAAVDPYLEVSGIIKALDNSFTLLFENIKGYPQARIMAGMFSRTDRVMSIFGAAAEGTGLKLKGLAALENRIPPLIVENAPCQFEVQTDDINIHRLIPVTTHTGADPGPILSGGLVLVDTPEFGRCIAYKRMHFRGADWASLMSNPTSHLAQIVAAYAKEHKNLPLTINISPPPSVLAVAGGGLLPKLIPLGSDELAIAGGLQGSAVEICRANTVDGYAIAASEWVIEGYIDTSEKVWESAAAEKTGDPELPFIPEGHGYMGMALEVQKFHVTAVTRRQDRPIYYAPLSHSFESPRMQIPINQALQYQALHDGFPTLVRDISALDGMKGRWYGLIVQVTKQSAADDAVVGGIIRAAFETAGSLRMVMVVDEDIDNHSPDEVIWALGTRLEAARDLMVLPPRDPGGIRVETVGPFAPVTRLGFDATIPFLHRARYRRGEYPEVDLARWLRPEQIAAARGLQGDYARLQARKRV